MCLRFTRPGSREAVAIMGTAHDAGPARRAGEGRRLGRRGVSARPRRGPRGPEAMLRAARLAEDRGVELRVVEHAGGHGPRRSRKRRGVRRVSGAHGTGRANDRVSGPPGTCRCRPGHSCRQGQSLGGGAQADRRRTRTHRNEGRARPRSRGPPRRPAGLRAWRRRRPERAPCRRPPRPLRPRPASSLCAQSASFLRAACRAEGSDTTILLGLRMTSSPRTCFARARDHLVAHFDDPLAGLPEDDPALGALVTDVALAAQERPPPRSWCSG